MERYDERRKVNRSSAKCATNATSAMYVAMNFEAARGSIHTVVSPCGGDPDPMLNTLAAANTARVLLVLLELSRKNGCLCRESICLQNALRSSLASGRSRGRLNGNGPL